MASCYDSSLLPTNVWLKKLIIKKGALPFATYFSVFSMSCTCSFCAGCGWAVVWSHSVWTDVRTSSTAVLTADTPSGSLTGCKSKRIYRFQQQNTNQEKKCRVFIFLILIDIFGLNCVDLINWWIFCGDLRQAKINLCH